MLISIFGPPYWIRHFEFFYTVTGFSYTVPRNIGKLNFNEGPGIFINDNLEKTRYFPSSPSAILNLPLIRLFHIFEEVCILLVNQTLTV